MKQLLITGVLAATMFTMSACGSTNSCDPTNCASGCCSASGVCETGNTAAACGKGGLACNTCDNSTACNSGVCGGIDPNSTWKVQPTSATVKNNNTGADWDPDQSAPDVKVRVYCPRNASDVTSTTEVSESYSPTWSTGGCVMKASDILAGGFAYQVVDEDVLGAEDNITTKTNVTVVEADLTAGVSSAVASDQLTAIRISLQRQ